MTRLLTTMLLVLALMLSHGMPDMAGAQTSEQLGTGDNLDCEHFRPAEEGGQDDANAVLLSDPGDPYRLDRGVDPLPCEDPTELGSADLANCQSFFSEEEGGRAHAQALYEATAPGDPYGLDANGDGRACFVETAQEAPPAAPVPSTPSTSGCVIVAEVAHASACAGGPVSVVADPEDEDALPVSTSRDVSTSGLLPSLIQRTAEQSTSAQETRTVESEQRTKAKQRKARKAKRSKQRQLERQRLRDQQ